MQFKQIRLQQLNRHLRITQLKESASSNMLNSTDHAVWLNNEMITNHLYCMSLVQLKMKQHLTLFGRYFG